MEAITAGVIGAAVGALGMFLAQSYFSFRDQEIAHINPPYSSKSLEMAGVLLKAV